MLFSNLDLTKQDFDKIDWQAIISNSEYKRCIKFRRAFHDEAQKAKDADDELLYEIYLLLEVICSVVLDSTSRTEPFKPRFIFRDSRGVMLDDVPEQYFDPLSEIVAEIADPEMRARIADVLWVKKHDYKNAELAIDSYLASARRLEETEDLHQSTVRIERAVGLAASLGKSNPHLQTTLDYCEQFLLRPTSQASYFAVRTIMEVLLQHNYGDFLGLSDLAEKLAQRAEDEQSWLNAEHFWRLKAQWEALAERPDSEHQAHIKAAETHVKAAQMEIDRPTPNHITAQSYVQSAITAYRKIPDTQERVKELHHLLLEYQELSRENMSTFSMQMDLSNVAGLAIEAVKGKGLYEALVSLALELVVPPSVISLRESVEESIDDPVRLLFSEELVDEKGRVIERKPSTFSNDANERELAIKIEMYRQAAMYHEVHAQGIIWPAVNQIASEHHIRESDFLGIVYNSPFIPPGREQFFLKGLFAGITLDLVTSAHLLVPQIENSIRHILQQRGVITSKLSSAGIQEQYDLNTLLNLHQTEEIFGLDHVFALQGVLIERYGWNLRNRMAHGLNNYNYFQSTRSLYVWWLTLRLCCLPIAAALYKQSDNDISATDMEDGDG